MPDLYVSPHLDDAALSCGGAISHASRQAGTRALGCTGDGSSAALPVVVTVFAAPLQLRSVLPQAVRFHRIMGFDHRTDPTTRRNEDIKAMAVLGAKPVHLDFDDCVYRTGPRGAAVAIEDDDVFGTDGGSPGTSSFEGDLSGTVARALCELVASLRPGRIVVPLGLGGHRDHLIARQAGESAWAASHDVEHTPALWYFEDAPYCLRTGAVEEAGMLAPRGAEPIDSRLAAEDLVSWLAAVGEYRSQQTVFWNETETLGAAIYRHAVELGGNNNPVERQWRAQR
ncbi:MAG: PIG-L deacetylase family protein [Acidimicrobiales bacterium]